MLTPRRRDFASTKDHIGEHFGGQPSGIAFLVRYPNDHFLS